MGALSSHKGRAVVAATLTLVIGIVGAAGEAGATGTSPSGSRCDRPLSTTLLQTAKVRVFAMPAESTTDPRHREPAIAGRPVFGCLESTGRSRLLDLGGAMNAFSVMVDPATVAANGPLVAYSYSRYYLDTHETLIRVRNLSTGGVIRDCVVGGAIAPRRGPRVTAIVLSSDGEVGWDAEGEDQGRSESQPPGCNPRA